MLFHGDFNQFRLVRGIFHQQHFYGIAHNVLCRLILVFKGWVFNKNAVNQLVSSKLRGHRSGRDLKTARHARRPPCSDGQFPPAHSTEHKIRSQSPDDRDLLGILPVGVSLFSAPLPARLTRSASHHRAIVPTGFETARLRRRLRQQGRYRRFQSSKAPTSDPSPGRPNRPSPK